MPRPRVASPARRGRRPSAGPSAWTGPPGATAPARRWPSATAETCARPRVRPPDAGPLALRNGHRTESGPGGRTPVRTRENSERRGALPDRRAPAAGAPARASCAGRTHERPALCTVPDIGGTRVYTCADAHLACPTGTEEGGGHSHQGTSARLQADRGRGTARRRHGRSVERIPEVPLWGSTRPPPDATPSWPGSTVISPRC